MPQATSATGTALAYIELHPSPLRTHLMTVTEWDGVRQAALCSLTNLTSGFIRKDKPDLEMCHLCASYLKKDTP